MSRKITFTIAGLVLIASLGAACGSAHMGGHSTATTPEDHMGDMQGGDDHMGHGAPSDVAPDARRVDVTAGSFTYDPHEIRARAGEDLAIVLTSADATHDFVIDELGVHVAADRGETETGGVSGLEPGSYTYYCTVSGHRAAGMEGTLVVE
ncbi:MAG: cupredoxin domain-containing protein [Acidimicrobiia bacterium]|nr:cupredoxin domain-containing protein [Acidimicrobiia bacterium]